MLIIYYPKKIKNKTIFKTVPLKQNYKLEKRYTKNKDFNDKILKDFYKKKISIKQIKENIKKRFNKNKFIYN